MKVMGIDPGETSGWAVCEFGVDKPFRILGCGQVNGDELLMSGLKVELPNTKYVDYRAQCLALMQVVHEFKPWAVIIEDFTLRQFTTMKAEGISAARIGAMLCVWLCEIMSGEKWFEARVIWQTPSQIAVINNARMKAVMPTAYKETAGLPHARDAIRHCEVYRRSH